MVQTDTMTRSLIGVFDIYFKRKILDIVTKPPLYPNTISKVHKFCKWCPCVYVRVIDTAILHSPYFSDIFILDR